MSQYIVTLRGWYRRKIIFFIISFYEIMHRTTIVQNKLISMICCCFFFVCLIFIGLVQGRCGQVGLTQNRFSHSIFISEGKKTFYSELYGLQCIAIRFLILIFIYLKKISLKNVSKKPVKMLNYIYNNYYLIFFLNQTAIHCSEYNFE